MTPEPETQDSFRDMLEDIRRSTREALTRLTELEASITKHDDLLYRGTNDIPGLAYRVLVIERDVAVFKSKESKIWAEVWKLIMAAIIGACTALASQFGWKSNS